MRRGRVVVPCKQSQFYSHGSSAVSCCAPQFKSQRSVSASKTTAPRARPELNALLSELLQDAERAKLGAKRLGSEDEAPAQPPPKSQPQRHRTQERGFVYREFKNWTPPLRKPPLFTFAPDAPLDYDHLPLPPPDYHRGTQPRAFS